MSINDSFKIHAFTLRSKRSICSLYVLYAVSEDRNTAIAVFKKARNNFRLVLKQFLFIKSLEKNAPL